jgi:hypothetical protein
LRDHRVGECAHITHRYDASVDAVSDQVLGRADGVGSDHGRATGQRLVDDDAPGLVPRRSQQ